MKRSVTDKLITFGTHAAAVILVLLPFHAFLTVSIGSFYGVYDALRLWKELLLVVLAVPVGYIVWRDKQIRDKLRFWPVVWLIAAYVAVHILMGGLAWVAGDVNLKALLYSWVVNLRFVLFFMICLVLAAKLEWLARDWQKLLFIPAAIVVTFGLMQAFLLPNDVLRHVGYGPDTITAYQSVDQKPDYARVQSTLRGPNPLGAYLVIVITAAICLLAKRNNSLALRWVLGGLLLGAITVLFYTYSRSAYIGAVVAAGVACWSLTRSPGGRRWLLIGATCFMLIGGTSIFMLRDNDIVQNTVFHTDEYSGSPRSSNEDRAGALQGGIKDLVSEPLGRGPGTAGPASVYNNNKVRIAENYYLQVGQEVGWVGLGLLMAIIITSGLSIVRGRPQLLAVALFASLIGISIINLLSHAWADDTLSLLWWGLAGIAISPAILSNRNEVR